MRMPKFKTPNGLKVRLDYLYFFLRLEENAEQCSREDLLNNDKLISAMETIDSTFAIPTMLVQLFSLIAIFVQPNITVFCLYSAFLYIFGYFWRFSRQFFPLSNIIFFFADFYKRTCFDWYLILAVTVFVVKSIYLIVPYVFIRLFSFLFSLVANTIILRHTKNKYGIPFNDTEMCAFRVFHDSEGSDLTMKEYVEEYVFFVKNMYEDFDSTQSIS